MGDEEPLYSVKGFVGKTRAEIQVFPNRIEWSGKAGLMKKTSSEVIPIKSVSSVSVEKSGLGKRKVKVFCSGNTIDIEVNTVEKAEQLKKAILDLIL